MICLKVPTSLKQADDRPVKIGASLFLPTANTPKQMFVCLPGGDMSRGFFDLHILDEDGPDNGDFSFAQTMTGMGFAVLTMDYPGVGDSDAVGDPYATTTNMVAAAMLAASRDVIALIREGGINGVEPMPALKCIGLGHSMGALFTVLQQSLNEPYRALVLLGFSTSGLPDKVPPEILAIANDPIKLQKQLPIWARTVFEAPPPVARRDKSFDKTRIVFKNDAADPRGLRALKAIRTKPRLPLPAVEAMLPGKVSLEAACTCVPIFLGVGEHDIAGPAHQLPVAFPASKEITLHVVESAGHSMFPFPSRHRLFTRIASWAKSLD